MRSEDGPHMICDDLVNECVSARCTGRLEKRRSEDNCGESCSSRKNQPGRKTYGWILLRAADPHAGSCADVKSRDMRGLIRQRAAQIAKCSFSSATICASL